MKGATRGVQVTIAKVLSGSRPGIDYLIKAVADASTDAAVLSEIQVKEGLSATASPKQQQQLQKLTAGSNASDDRMELIKERLASYDPSKVTEEKGHQLFIQNCSMCHQINGKGGTIGPTLSGIGSWGQKALTQKILSIKRQLKHRR